MTTALTSIDRARAYVSKVPPAISGRCGHDQTFSVAVALVHGFLLSEADALALLREWNQSCLPPWSESDLRYKVRSALSITPRKPKGWLLGEASSHTMQTIDPEAKRAAWPKFGTPNLPDLRHIGELRNIGTTGLVLAVERQLLYVADYKGSPCWIITDSSRRLAQARRMDGQPFTLPDGTSTKALTLPGSIASLPLGLPQAGPFANLMLVEGGPDLLAAFHFIACESRQHDCTAICMLGASQRIAESALPVFADKWVRIFRHTDQSGCIAAAHWTRALLPVVRKIDGFDFSSFHQIGGTPVKDLNDLCFIDADEFEENRSLWSICPG